MEGTHVLCGEANRRLQIRHIGLAIDPLRGNSQDRNTLRLWNLFTLDYILLPQTNCLELVQPLIAREEIHTK